MSSYFNDINYILNDVIAGDKCTNWNAYDGNGTTKKLLKRHEGSQIPQSQTAFNNLVNAIQPGERIYITFSTKTNEEKGRGNVADAYSLYFVKPSSDSSAQVGAVAQTNNREDLINDRWTMELKYRDEIRDLKDELRRTKEAQEPKFIESLLANTLQDPQGPSKLLGMVGTLIGAIKGQPQMVAGVTPQTDNTTHSETNEAQGRLTAALTSLSQLEPEYIEVLEALNKFLSNPNNRGQYEMIKSALLNAN